MCFETGKCRKHIGHYPHCKLNVTNLCVLCTSPTQNYRQKVVHRGALRLCEGALRSCRGGLTFKFDKNSTNSVWYFNLQGLEALGGGLSPSKSPVATGLPPLLTWGRARIEVTTNQKWLRIRSDGVDSGRILCFFGPGDEVKILWKTWPGSVVTFHFQQ